MAKNILTTILKNPGQPLRLSSGFQSRVKQLFRMRRQQALWKARGPGVVYMYADSVGEVVGHALQPGREDYAAVLASRFARQKDLCDGFIPTDRIKDDGPDIVREVDLAVVELLFDCTQGSVMGWRNFRGAYVAESPEGIRAAFTKRLLGRGAGERYAPQVDGSFSVSRNFVGRYAAALRMMKQADLLRKEYGNIDEETARIIGRAVAFALDPGNMGLERHLGQQFATELASLFRVFVPNSPRARFWLNITRGDGYLLWQAVASSPVPLNIGLMRKMELGEIRVVTSAEILARRLLDASMFASDTEIAAREAEARGRA